MPAKLQNTTAYKQCKQWQWQCMHRPAEAVQWAKLKGRCKTAKGTEQANKKPHLRVSYSWSVCFHTAHMMHATAVAKQSLLTMLFMSTRVPKTGILINTCSDHTFLYGPTKDTALLGGHSLHRGCSIGCINICQGCWQ